MHAIVSRTPILQCQDKTDPSIDVGATLRTWQDAEKMAPYASAVSAFRRLFEECMTAPWNAKCDNGFETRKGANPYHGRSKEGILMEVEFYGGDVTKVHNLLTPLGEVSVVGGGCGLAIGTVSRALMARLPEIAEFVDVTDRVSRRWMDLRAEPDAKSWRVASRWDFCNCNLSGRVFKTYLLRFREDFAFAGAVNAPPDGLCVFCSIEGADYDADLAMVKQLTDGRGTF